ncbi:MAG: MFS transporter [Rhodospirillales bacterium]|nr:MFS transporter [Rhodospirillales bacterium]MDE2200019.1 MFS transporter [Rhodospirillales bacterium]MDE2573685.1 MFS transporter [Rhodospirillales bacterium]
MRDQPTEDVGAIVARLDRLPATRSIRQIVVLLSLGMFFELYELFFTGYVAPGLVKGGILTTSTPGLFGTTGVASFIAALFAGLFVGTLLCGQLADRFGRRAIFTWSLIWYAAASALMAFQTDAFGLNLFRFLAGIGIGVELVTIDTYIAEIVPKHLRGRAFAFSQAVGFAAVPIVALLAWQLVPAKPFGLDGWRWLVLIGSSSSVFVWWIRLRLPESPRWLVLHGHAAEAERVTADLEARVAAEYGATLPPPAAAEPAGPRGGFIELWKPPYLSRTIMMSLFNVFQTVGYYGFANWVPTLLIKQGVSLPHSLFYTTLIAIAAPLGPLLGMLVADRMERRTIIVFGALATAVCGLIFSQARAPGLLIAMGVCLTLAGNVISFAYHAYQTELFPTRIRAMAVGFVYSWSRISAAFTAFFIAFILGHSGVPGVFAFVAGSMLIVMLTIGLMGPRTNQLALEHISS